MTGVASIDCFIPVGCGQRELIIGDQNTGKTSLAITAIINQSYRNNVLCGLFKNSSWCSFQPSLFFPCVYVSIGSKRSEIVRLRKILSSKEALNYTCIIFASADDLAALQYLAPFAGCTIGEWFMNNGYNAVVVYDDLTQHAIAYRQMALLLRRPPGREAYPGDIFFLHARLLERSAQLSKGGSLTALPIVQTLGGDLSGYISTNVISITDGQIFLVKSLINKGIRPAVDLSLSVSRVGSAAQYSAMSFVSKRVKIVFSLYKIYAGMAKMGGEDPEVMIHVNRGERMLNFFTQALYETYSFYKQVVCLFALTIESTDVVIPSKVQMFFTLLSLKQFSYLLGIEKRIVNFFLNVRLIEPLLMVFSFDLIQKDLTTLINSFSAFFNSEVQHSCTTEAAYLINELITRHRSNGPIIW
jgi:proton translocating ATP synthase F1 alpha subunit